ncbi:hypothetical protein SDRG_08639 [Saprolegnia diclina VS20]|uniref:Uncharacterized protein n=1 Tax=Saprolegnia diclina (strain VS20) TaxID=1156394 RepID=T0QJQ8_SAPDV|nr:hypothetical protein SDRG_08639 [Saprolegnia diclina VS20]EQC33960.1 hypothetical protein SDRG_08639 [Saprolegnia diclina VS20]|eukprot:XP_008612755.1 hypothetical protein SDRG_08639 [Saprolegnia diclina VS20]
MPDQRNAAFLHAPQPCVATVDEQDMYCLTSHDDPHFVYHKAIANGDLKTVRRLLPVWDNDRAMDVAAMHGQVDVLLFLHKASQVGCTTRAMDYAAAYGQMECLRFLHQFRNEGCSRQALLYAVRNDHVYCVLYLWRHQPQPHWFRLDAAIRFAKEYKQRRVLKALQQIRRDQETSPTSFLQRHVWRPLRSRLTHF